VSQLCQILNGLPAKAAFVYEYKEGAASSGFRR